MALTPALQRYDHRLSGAMSIPLVYVKGGRCQIGDESGSEGWEKPVHEVELSDFWMAQYPVSQRLWDFVMRDFEASEAVASSHWQGADRPMESISWNDGKDFIDRLNQKLGLAGNRAFRFPTSAEWEYAARGGIYSRRTPFAGSAKLSKVGWYGENSFEQTHPQGLTLPNELGLYEMSGGLWEWVGDWYEGNYYTECAKSGQSIDPQGPDSGLLRVLRGGSWGREEQGCGVAIRDDHVPFHRNRYLGLRLSRTKIS